MTGFGLCFHCAYHFGIISRTNASNVQHKRTSSVNTRTHGIIHLTTQLEKNETFFFVRHLLLCACDCTCRWAARWAAGFSVLLGGCATNVGVIPFRTANWFDCSQSRICICVCVLCRFASHLPLRRWSFVSSTSSYKYGRMVVVKYIIRHCAVFSPYGWSETERKIVFSGGWRRSSFISVSQPESQRKSLHAQRRYTHAHANGAHIRRRQKGGQKCRVTANLYLHHRFAQTHTHIWEHWLVAGR